MKGRYFLLLFLFSAPAAKLYAENLPQTVDKGSVEVVKSLVVPELYDAVKYGKFSFRTAARNKAAAQPDAELTSNAEEIFSDVSKQSVPPYKYSERQIEMLWADPKGASSTVSGTVLRESLNPQAPDKVSLKESVQFTAPAAVKNFNFFTYRLSGEDEDRVWEYSPIISKLRQLAGTNRSDSFFESSFSLDDLDVWSGKKELVAVNGVSAGTWFAPPEMPEAALQDTIPEGCKTWSQTDPSLRQMISVQQQANAVDQGSMTPLSIGFVKRQMIRLELKQKDVFSRYGVQVLYLDYRTKAPIYKIVLDESGSVLKIVFAAGSKIPQYIAAVDISRQLIGVILYSSGIGCDQIPEDVDQKRFNPFDTAASLAPKSDKGKKDSKEIKSTPAPEDTDE
jgi:hypothetical protein